MAQNVLPSGGAAGGVPASIVYVASESYSFVVASMFAIRQPWRCRQTPPGGRSLLTMPASATGH